jgi:hypothetical protein
MGAERLGLMRAAPSYKHGDVFADIVRAVENAASTFSPDDLELITPELGRFADERSAEARDIPLMSNATLDEQPCEPSSVRRGSANPLVTSPPAGP